MRRLNTSMTTMTQKLRNRMDSQRKHVEGPKAILGLRDECQPGGAIGAGVVWPIVLGEHAAHDILVYVEAKGMGNLLGELYTAKLGITPFQIDNCRNEFGGGAFGPGLRGRLEDENRMRYLRSINALRNLKDVADFTIEESFGMRRGLTKRVISPSAKRSTNVRFGARWRERLLTMRCCLSNRDSAATARTPPGRRSFAIVTTR